MQELITEWCERIRAAAASGEPLAIRGGGSKQFYGEDSRGEPLDTRGHRGIVDYEPTELVLRARAGTPLREIESALAAERQMLAFEPPHFGTDATLGGTIACGLSGPRRAALGSARDFVLGVRIVDGRGDDLAFGGQVMKNVAGYDVSRLMVGAMGTLGVILDVSLKVLPAPAHELTLVFELNPADALRRLNTWAGKPYPISASCHDGTVLHVRLSGTASGVEAMAQRLGGERMQEGAAYWRSLREHELPFFDSPEALWRVSLKSTTPLLPLPGRHLIEWNGALRWVKSDADAQLVRDVARKAGGHATLFRRALPCGAGGAGGERGRGGAEPVFQPLSPALMELHRRLKQTFDPAGILNRGRLYPEL